MTTHARPNDVAPPHDHEPADHGAASTRARRRRHWLMPLAVAPAVLALAVTSPTNPAAGASPRPVAARAAAAVEAAAPAPRAVAPAPARHPTATATASHLVQPGETLSHVALRYGVSTADLAAANGLSDPDFVRSGTELTIPAAGSTSVAVATEPIVAATASASSALPERLRASPDRLAYLPTFERWASANGIPADLLEAMTWLESGWQQGQVSSTGAVGIGQLMPDTVDHMEMLIGVDLDASSAEDNIRMSARYLRLLLGRYGSPEGALAAYYQGAGSVEANGTFAETDRYVANVLALRSQF
ncbi:MAG TPA: transglycosylase SLT domain-containing protein [Iamia sp.]|nr:transglycosylase SLT domain-containing protein [Iamia sp.]